TPALLSCRLADWSVAGHRQQLSGNQAVSRKTTANLFKAGDAYILLAVNNEKQYRALMSAIGREDTLSDPRFADWFARNENEPALRAIIEEALAKKSPREWETILEDAGAPWASIWTIEEIIDHPQIRRAAPSRSWIRPTAACDLPAAAFSSRMAAASSTAWRRSLERIRMRCWASWVTMRRRS